MLTILYSFNKTGFEAEYWTREIAAASTGDVRFVPFNHGSYLAPGCYIRAQMLDDLYFARHQSLEGLYAAMEDLSRSVGADALLVDNCPPYHPDYLKRLRVYKVLRIADGPMSAYDRDIPYAHAYDHVLYHSPAYSRDMGMAEKLAYCGARRADFWPLALFDAMCDPARSEAALFSQPRDVDVIFIGALHPNKMPLLATVKRAFGRRFVMHGLTSIKKSAYFALRHRAATWVRPIAATEYVPLYQRAKIGINVHNRGVYTVGSYRLFELPGNGVMQLSDGGEYLEAFFRRDDEIVGYTAADDLVDLLRHYLEHEAERRRIAVNGYRRVMQDHRIASRLHEAAALIREGMRSR